MDIKQLARQRIAEAEAAIAAAGKSAMSTSQTGEFRSDVRPPIPWASSHERGFAPPSQFPSSFAERLKIHEAHLNALKQASKMPPLQRNALAPPAQPRTFSSLSDPSASSLPPWSQPHHMPTFQRTLQTDQSLGSAKSLEGSRVSTAGSGATIGWAGPWVVTHRQGGPDRMYPANLRPDGSQGSLQQHSALQASGAAPQRPSRHAPAAEAAPASSKQTAVQPASVEWLLPQRHSHAPPAGHLSAAPVARTSAADAYDARTAAHLAERPHGIPGAPVEGSPPSRSRQGQGSNIPSPVRRAALERSGQRLQHVIDHCAQCPGERAMEHAAASAGSAMPASAGTPPAYGGQRRQPATIKRGGEHVPYGTYASAEPSQSRHARDQADADRLNGHAQRKTAHSRQPLPLQHAHTAQTTAVDGKSGAAAAYSTSAAAQQPIHHLNAAGHQAGRAPGSGGGRSDTRLVPGRSRPPFSGGDGDLHESSSDLSAPMARLKRLLRTRSIEAATPVAVEERPAGKSAADRHHARVHIGGGTATDAGSLKPSSARVLQQSPSRSKACSGLRKLRGRHNAADTNSGAHTQTVPEGQAVRSLDEQPAVAQTAHSSFDAVIEQKLREEQAVAAGDGDARRECRTCGRRFAEDVLAKHQAICAKAGTWTRRPMDMRRKRLQGVVEEAPSMPRRKGRGPHTSGRPADGTAQRRGADETPVGGVGSRAQAWKRKSDAFRAAMRANREVNAARMRGEDITKMPVFEDEHDDRVPCPHCGRKFAALTAERHIPKCQHIRAKPAFLKRGSGIAGGKTARRQAR
eukprot:jgi/Ulvmu1/5031/UM021_0048.1